MRRHFKLKCNLFISVNVTYCSSSCIITVLLGHFRVCTVPLDNSNAANKPRILSIQFSKTGSYNMSAFTSVLDIHADIMDNLWIIFVLPALFCYMALFITQSACTFSKKFWKLQKFHREKKFKTWSSFSRR